ncbi:MAG: epoxyqueuosine reductase [Clostridia bacterium]|nr:epoxyqueuosine reductase [Clostridia bacterium]
MLNNLLKSLFTDETLYGFVGIGEQLRLQSGCRCALVTLLPFPDMDKKYRPDEFFIMNEELSKMHAKKINEIKKYLDAQHIAYASPPAGPKNDGEYRADFSYKWAAIHAGLGFIGKNDVFVHYKFGQRVRISCLLIDIEAPQSQYVVESKCGDCNLCVQACPHHYISGKEWSESACREDLVDFKNCATKSKHFGEGKKYLCCHCVMACPWHTKQE